MCPTNTNPDNKQGRFHFWEASGSSTGTKGVGLLSEPVHACCRGQSMRLVVRSSVNLTCLAIAPKAGDPKVIPSV